MSAEDNRDLVISPFDNIYTDIKPYVTQAYLENHDILNEYLCTDINHNGSFEIPIAILPYLETILAKPEIKWKQIAVPLYYGATVMRSTANSILKCFFKETLVSNKRLSKVITNKGEVYYGGKGMIFDNYMNPLVLYTVTVEDMSSIDYTYGSQKRRASISALNVRVSPQVLTKDTMIKKNIISKIIPSIVSKSILVLRGVSLEKPITPKVIIEDLSEWIKRPAKVSNPQTFKEDMQQFLSRKDIIQDIIDCL